MQEPINNQSMLKVGTILRGTYRIDSYLSSGGFGNTYVATNVEFDERVAIKEFFMKGVTHRDDNQTTISVSNAENRNSFLEQKEKFKKEARRIRQLRNEHIVNVHDLFEENGTAYYVMDYVDGENLAERLQKTGRPMTETEVRFYLPQILDALKAVHNAGIWHLDLKPANIMLDNYGHIKIIDFGASKQLNSQKGGATTSTAITYTNGYAPREQMEQNYDKFGPWTDIYALGATLYNLLTNKRPPLPTDIDDDLTSDKHEALPFPEGVGDTRYIVLQMMKTNRTQRPQNVEIVAALLEKQKSRSEDDDEITILATSNNVLNEETDIVLKEEKDKIKTNKDDAFFCITPLQTFIIKYTSIAFLVFLSVHCIFNLISVFSEDTYNRICYIAHNNLFFAFFMQFLAIFVVAHIFYASFLAYKGLIPRQNITPLIIIILIGLLHMRNFWYNMMFAEIIGVMPMIAPDDGFSWILETFGNPLFCLLYLLWFISIWLYLYNGFWSVIQIADKEKRICKNSKKKIYNACAAFLILCYFAILISFAFGIAPSLITYS